MFSCSFRFSLITHYTLLQAPCQALIEEKPIYHTRNNTHIQYDTPCNIGIEGPLSNNPFVQQKFHEDTLLHLQFTKPGPVLNPPKAPERGGYIPFGSLHRTWGLPPPLNLPSPQRSHSGGMVLAVSVHCELSTPYVWTTEVTLNQLHGTPSIKGRELVSRHPFEGTLTAANLLNLSSISNTTTQAAQSQALSLSFSEMAARAFHIFHRASLRASTEAPVRSRNRQYFSS